MQDPYSTIAVYYDLEHDDFRADVDFYLNLFEPSPVLEIGTGTGRIARALSESGFEVWGIDASSAMLARAVDRLGTNPRVHLINESILDLNLGRRFPAAILPLNTLWHLPDIAQQRDALESIRRHLDAGGILCIDNSNPLTLADRGSRGDVRMRFSGVWNGRRVTCLSASWDDEKNQVIRLELMYDEIDSRGRLTRAQSCLSLRYVFRDELEEMLRDAGFQPRQTYGSYDLNPYTADSASLVVVSVAI
jgi:SAM-dependent methyltransferase